MKTTIMSLLFLISFTVVLFACSNDDDSKQPGKSVTYVLVHGAWQAPYVWDNVKASLEKNGHHALVVELPGHGNDQTAPQHLSIDVYRDKVIETLNKIDGKVILVGHSLGGMVISAVAEKVPAKIQELVYIGAYLPSSGQSLLDLANTDADALLGPSLRPSTDQLTLDVLRDNITNIFIQDGTDAIKNLVLKNYRAEPAIPFTNKVVLTSGNFGSVNKIYIKTLQDHVISPSLQGRMISAAGIKNIFQLNTGHSPFLSKPDSVSTLLINIGH
ncbi:alpha/beta fold hydrolase [Dyadobacter subterraneus]|uniref:Alpha/beta fold hydrolase n=1 Tax=Dyadobacter subterraneus TaxID=2773304 RepID=A0ABR9W8V9_9BACT|nr:alpha/beta fold hydrolase [Dyadobacter subterraneus]MBE9461885.1 alpha/beta fold hydrolase [Dyadobacter subterraneus]